AVVVAVHITSLTVGTTARGAVTAGAFLSVLHVTREVFVFLTAFVLAYRHREVGIVPVPFWRRRYPLVLVPYAAWTLIYVLADGRLDSLATAGRTLLVDLATGQARFHLYFLLLTFQMYAVLPWVLRWVRSAPPRRLLAVSAAAELAFCAGTHYWTSAPGVVGTVLRHSGSWLWSYQLYFLAGVVAAVHLEAATGWVRSHGRLIAAAALVALAIGLGGYYLDLHVAGMTPLRASEVLQPTVVVESIAAIAAQYAAGLWVTDRIASRSRARLLAVSDASFGVYLAHPLLLQGLVDLAVVIGLAGALGHLAPLLQMVLVLVVAVPGLYLVSGALVA
ncbi:MAG: acyltransferase family protein, partial [Candidatus Dormibacteria bacterium]